MACSCKQGKVTTTKTVKQVVKKIPVDKDSSSKSNDIKKRVVKRITYRRPI